MLPSTLLCVSLGKLLVDDAETAVNQDRLGLLRDTACGLRAFPVRTSVSCCCAHGNERSLQRTLYKLRTGLYDFCTSAVIPSRDSRWSCAALLASKYIARQAVKMDRVRVT